MLKVVNLEAGYGTLRVLEGVSLHVDEGELVTVFGHNGSGKSTLVKAIMGEIPVWDGTVFFRGKMVTGLPPERLVRRGLVFVPEGRELFSDLTVMENLRIGSYPLRPSASEYHEILGEVFELFPVLEGRLKQKAGTLSGGEQQMLAVARGMMASPQLLVLDEPSIGLAPKLVQELYGKIGQLHKRGITILLIEQNVHLALEYADRAYVIENGRITLQGSSSELIGDPRIKSAYLGE